MKSRRVLSVLLAVLMVMSCMTVLGSVVAFGAEADVAESSSAYTDMLSKITPENKYGLSETVDDGLTLQAWNWSFANIEANLTKVAEQGFTTIQVSPPNEIKKATKGVNVTQGDTNGWWMFYQPVAFQMNQSTNNALGTKAEFVSMCEKAHALGLKVIVDAVINHVGTKDGTPDSDSTVMNHVHDSVKTYEPVIYNNQLFHSPWKKMEYIESNNTQYNSTYDLTRNCTSGLPDLKTEDQRVQDAIFDYLDELVTAGADGFRFDAAKHIETPDDISSLASDFWTDTLKKVQSKYPGKEIYAYGEILNTCGIGRPYTMYTKLFDVTDSASYWNIKDAVCGNGGNATPYYPNSNFTASNTVLWDESHDTYIDGATTSLTSAQRSKIWALVAGRNGISSVYLARPDDNGTGSLSNIKLGDVKMTTWSNATTKAINQFHNYFIGQTEYCTNNSGGTAYIERGTTGAMIVNLGGTTSKSVNLKANRLKAGTYKDAISGNTFTVSGGYIKGQVGTTGIAAIYENEATPLPTTPPETEPPVTYILGDVNGDGEANVADATMILRACVDLITLDDKQTLAADVDGDGFITTIDATLIQRFDADMPVKFDIGKEKTTYITPEPTTPTPTTPVPTTPIPTTYQPTTPEPNDYFILTDNFGWGTAYVYAWNDSGDELYGAWPGAAQAETITNDMGETQFKCYVPDGATGVIVNNGNGAQTEDITDFTTYDGYWMDGTQNELGHYKVTGWNYDPDPQPTDPTPIPSGDDGFYLVGTFNEWTPSSAYKFTENSAAPGEYMLSTSLTATDGVKVVKAENGAIATWYPDGMDNEYVVDADHAGAVTIYFKDTYQADWATFGGYMYIDNGSTPDPQPTDPTPQPTDPQPTTPVESSVSFLLTDNFGWGTAYVYAWNDNGDELYGAWPGAAQAETITNDMGETQFKCYVPDGATGVIINNGNGAQTEDITDFTTYDGYWMDGTQNELGHYKVTGWNADPTPQPTDPQPTATTLTLVPGVWNQDGARYAAYFFGNGETWVDLVNNSVEVPDGYTSVIFVRMNPASSTNSWDNKWNQTSDLTIPSGGGTYTITGWGESDGHW